MQTGERAALHDSMGKLSSGLALQSDVRDAWEATRGSAVVPTWLCCELDPAVKNSVKLRRCGAGLAELDALLADGDICFVVCNARIVRSRWR